MSVLVNYFKDWLCHMGGRAGEAHVVGTSHQEERAVQQVPPPTWNGSSSRWLLHTDDEASTFLLSSGLHLLRTVLVSPGEHQLCDVAGFYPPSLSSWQRLTSIDNNSLSVNMLYVNLWTVFLYFSPRFDPFFKVVLMLIIIAQTKIVNEVSKGSFRLFLSNSK